MAVYTYIHYYTFIYLYNIYTVYKIPVPPSTKYTCASGVYFMCWKETPPASCSHAVVIIVSAIYSGVFVVPIDKENTLISAYVAQDLHR